MSVDLCDSTKDYFEMVLAVTTRELDHQYAKIELMQSWFNFEPRLVSQSEYLSEGWMCGSTTCCKQSQVVFLNINMQGS